MALQVVIVLPIEPDFLKILVIQAYHRERVRLFKYRFGHELHVHVHIELYANQALDILVAILVFAIVAYPDPVVCVMSAVLRLISIKNRWLISLNVHVIFVIFNQLAETPKLRVDLFLISDDPISWVNTLIILIQDHDPVSVDILSGTKAPEHLFLPHLMKLLNRFIVLPFFGVAVGGVSIDGQVVVSSICNYLWINMRVRIWIDWEGLTIFVRLLVEIAYAHCRVNERLVSHVEGGGDSLAGVD